ncbi:MAG: hypothetical protein ACRCYQ_07800, partial [Nocardioides sp.]
AWASAPRLAAIVVGPEHVATLGSAEAPPAPVIATALQPLGGRFPDGVPAGVRDFGAEIWSQPDSFLGADPPGPDDPATGRAAVGTASGRESDGRPGGVTHRELLEAAHSRGSLTAGDRTLSVRNPVAEPLTFVEVVVRAGSLVLVRNPDRSRLVDLYRSERCTATDPELVPPVS